jgi:cytochrome c oxidase subunit 4
MSRESNPAAEHIVPIRVYLGVALALFILTGITVAVSFIPLGGWNVAVAVSIASLKAALVALIFMHLLYDKKLLMIIFLAAITFLAVFIILTMFDTMERGTVDEASAEPIRKEAAMYDSLKTQPPPAEGEH